MSKDHRIRTPFQGEFLVAKTQAWKAWAMVSNRFAVRQLRRSKPGTPNSEPGTPNPELQRHAEQMAVKPV
jgi:hypothetical protein